MLIREQKHHIYENIIFGILLQKSCENDKYLASVIYDLLITYDEIIEETKTVPGNFNEKK